MGVKLCVQKAKQKTCQWVRLDEYCGPIIVQKVFECKQVSLNWNQFFS